jgi:glycosyltransferase involved in cell wall biosynthesis
MSATLASRVRRMQSRLRMPGIYRVTLAVLHPLNLVLARLFRGSVHSNSVLHVSYMVHIPYHTTRILRCHGWKADYLAVGTSTVWDKCDYRKSDRWSPFLALGEFVLFWRVVARYEVVHLHFMTTMSVNGWELPLLKSMGRKIVVHWRGCEVRDRERNMALHPDVNICQRCDYDATLCRSPQNAARRALAARYADHALVTTPDMLEFVPGAEHFTFFAPEALPPPATRPARGSGRFRIVHATNHPGIEGTDEIAAAIERLRARGRDIEFVFLKGVPHERVLAELATADLAIGKMKMGAYANAQIESMALGVPTVTYVRPEFVTPELENSGFILTSLGNLEDTLDFYLRNRDALEAKRRIARESILKLHDNDRLAHRLIAIYERVKSAR